MTDNQPQVENIPVENAPPVKVEEPVQRRHKVKVDGIESEVDETELISNYQKGRSAEKKFQEAADMRKQVESFVENVKANPAQLLEQLGLNPSEWAKSLLLAEIEAEQQKDDPNMQAIRELKAEVKALKEETTKVKEIDSKKKQEAEEAEIVQRLDTSIHSALKELGFGDHAPAEIVADIAEHMLMELKTTQKHLEPKEAYSRAKESFTRRLNAISQKRPEAMLELLSSEHLDKIAEMYIAKRKPKDIPSIRSQTSSKPEVLEDKLNKSLSDFFKRV